jgi:abhydrolase domain-containing protein 5
MVNRLPALEPDIPISFIYGVSSWIVREPWRIVKERRIVSIVNLHVITGAGHHVYSDTKEKFNELVLGACMETDHRRSAAATAGVGHHSPPTTSALWAFRSLPQSERASSSSSPHFFLLFLSCYFFAQSFSGSVANFSRLPASSVTSHVPHFLSRDVEFFCFTVERGGFLWQTKYGIICCDGHYFKGCDRSGFCALLQHRARQRPWRVDVVVCHGWHPSGVPTPI